MDIIIIYNIYNTLLVGGFNHLEKYESQWEGLSHILWKIKMFETTNKTFLLLLCKQMDNICRYCSF